MGQFCNLMFLHAKFWEIKSKEKLTGLFWKEYYFRGKGGGGGGGGVITLLFKK